MRKKGIAFLLVLVMALGGTITALAATANRDTANRAEVTEMLRELGQSAERATDIANLFAELGIYVPASVLENPVREITLTPEESAAFHANLVSLEELQARATQNSRMDTFATRDLPMYAGQLTREQMVQIAEQTGMSIEEVANIPVTIVYANAEDVEAMLASAANLSDINLNNALADGVAEPNNVLCALFGHGSTTQSIGGFYIVHTIFMNHPIWPPGTHIGCVLVATVITSCTRCGATLDVSVATVGPAC